MIFSYNTNHYSTIMTQKKKEKWIKIGAIAIVVIFLLTALAVAVTASVK